MTYITRDRKGGNPLEEFDSLDEAEQVLIEYVESDRAEGIYSPEFYEIYDEVSEEVVGISE